MKGSSFVFFFVFGSDEEKKEKGGNEGNNVQHVPYYDVVYEFPHLASK